MMIKQMLYQMVRKTWFVQEQQFWAALEREDFVTQRLVWRVKIVQKFPLSRRSSTNKQKYLYIPEMSSNIVPTLPMQQPEIIAADPELKQTWESVNHWCEGFTRCEEEQKKNEELRKVAGHIQFACKFFSIRLKDFIQKQGEKSPAKSSALRTLRQMHAVSKWVSRRYISQSNNANLWLAADR